MSDNKVAKNIHLQFYVDNLFQRLVALVCPTVRLNGAVVARKAAPKESKAESAPWKRIDAVSVGGNTTYYVEVGFKRVEDADRAFVDGVANLKHRVADAKGRPSDDMKAEIRTLWNTIRPNDFEDAAKFLLLTAKPSKGKTLVPIKVETKQGDTFTFRVSAKVFASNRAAILACFAPNVTATVIVESSKSETAPETETETPETVEIPLAATA